VIHHHFTEAMPFHKGRIIAERLARGRSVPNVDIVLQIAGRAVKNFIPTSEVTR
jgi:hypothetical protein